MRILLVHPGADFSVSDVHDGYKKGFEALGCDVASYNMNDRLVFFANALWEGEKLSGEEIVSHAGLGLHGKLWEWWPDIVVVISGFYVHPWTWEILKGRPHRTAVVFTESPYEDDRQLNLVEKAEPDVVVLNDPVNIGDYRAVHDNVVYLPHCYDPDVHYPGTTKPDTDFVFVGTAYPSRIQFFERVDWTGIDAKLAGHWQDMTGSVLAPFIQGAPKECLPNHETADWYRRARIAANLYRHESNRPDLEAGWAMGPREVELAACGTFFLREPRSEGDMVLDMLPTFENPEDFSEKLRWWLRHDRQREKAAARARAAVECRTFDQNCRRLLQLADQT